MTRPEFSWRWSDCPDGVLRYVLLEHRRSSTDHHLDLMLEVASSDDDEKRDLLCLEFASDTCFESSSLNGSDHGLHRRVYLWFEGRLEHVGGSVRRLASGQYRIREIQQNGQPVLEFIGGVMAGFFSLERMTDGVVCLERTKTKL